MIPDAFLPAALFGRLLFAFFQGVSGRNGAFFSRSHCAAISDASVFRSLIPATVFQPEQTGQPAPYHMRETSMACQLCPCSHIHQIYLSEPEERVRKELPPAMTCLPLQIGQFAPAVRTLTVASHVSPFAHFHAAFLLLPLETLSGVMGRFCSVSHSSNRYCIRQRMQYSRKDSFIFILRGSAVCFLIQCFFFPLFWLLPSQAANCG